MIKKNNTKKDQTDKTDEKQSSKGSKYIELNPTIDEARGQIAVVAFGRMNPPTIGHQKLVDKVKLEAKKRGGKAFVFLSHSYDSKKNPLKYANKIQFARKAFGDVVVDSPSRNIIEISKEIESKGFTSLIFVAGSDRVPEFSNLLTKYNGKEYNFDDVEVISAGDRDPDGDDVSAMSASKMRVAAKAGQKDAFIAGLPPKLRPMGNKVFDMVAEDRDYAEFLEDELLLGEALDASQRRKRRMQMRRSKKKIARGRRISARKIATTDKLQRRAKRAAIKATRKKVAGKKGEKYNELSFNQRKAIDLRVARRKPMVDRTARRLLPKTRKADRERFRNKMRREDVNHMFEQVFDSDPLLQTVESIVDGVLQGLDQQTIIEKAQHKFGGLSNGR